MSTSLPPTVQVESNPYPTGVGSAGEFDFAELLEIIRQQHNLSQVGDTTLPWNYVTELSDAEKYHRGSKGRFAHPDFGLIQARYVKFASMAITDTGVPVGWLQANHLGFQWSATNNFGLSSNENLVGLIGADVVPANGQFGWIIEQGINIRSVTYAGAGIPVLGQDVQWNASGVVGSGGGRNLGKIMNATGITALGGGQWMIPPASILVGWR